MVTVLIYAPDGESRHGLASALRGLGLGVLCCATPAEARDVLHTLQVQAVVVPGEDPGLERLLGVPAVAVEPDLDPPAIVQRVRRRLDLR